MNTYVLSQTFTADTVLGHPLAFVQAENLDEALVRFEKKLKLDFPTDKITSAHDFLNTFRAEITVESPQMNFVFSVVKIEEW
jgi:hypothetical protein